MFAFFLLLFLLVRPLHGDNPHDKKKTKWESAVLRVRDAIYLGEFHEAVLF